MSGFLYDFTGSDSGDARYLEQSNWYIDAVNGNDTNDGSTTLTALKTAAELYRRLGPQARLNPVYNSALFAKGFFITILSDLPITDPLHLDFVLTAGVSVIVRGGTRTVLRTGTFTSVTAKNVTLGTCARLAVTDTALPANNTWTSYIGARVRITSGARNNYVWWVDKDLGTKQANLSEGALCKQMRGLNVWDVMEVGLTQADPQVGDAYAIELLPKITIGVFNVRAEGSPDLSNYYPNKLVIGELAINVRGESAYGISVPYLPGVIFNTYSCRFAGMHSNTMNWYSQNDCWSSDYVLGGGGALVLDSGFMFKGGGLINAGSAGTFCRITVNPGASIYLHNDAAVSKGQIGIGGQARIHSCSVWDCLSNAGSPGGHGVYIGEVVYTGNDPNCPGAAASLGSYVSGGGTVRLWGAGNAGAGVFVGPGNTMTFPTAIRPVVTGTVGDFRLGASGTSTARAWDESGGAYTTARNCTWTLLGTAIGSGGFGVGGNAHNLALRSSIVGQ